MIISKCVATNARISKTALIRAFRGNPLRFLSFRLHLGTINLNTMSADIKEWIVVAIFLIFFVATIIGEVIWLVRRQWANSSRAVAYVLISR